MVCARRGGVYAFVIGFFVCSQVIAVDVFGKGDKDDKTLNSLNSASVNPVTEFQWKDHNKLSWEDFRGPVNAASDESAAATHCGIGFRVNNAGVSGKPEVVVYNSFYINKSWVRPDAKIATILDHEQGHFDLCEIYTRRLRALLAEYRFDGKDAKPALMNIFTAINDEYESRQQAYESETGHGTNLAQQKKWQGIIGRELN